MAAESSGRGPFRASRRAFSLAISLRQSGMLLLQALAAMANSASPDSSIWKQPGEKRSSFQARPRLLSASYSKLW